MKTVYEIEAFLRRGGHTLRLEPPVNGKFGASVLDEVGRLKASGASSTLADAVENAMIELRSKPRPAPFVMSGWRSGFGLPPSVMTRCPGCRSPKTVTLGVRQNCVCGMQWVP